MALLASLSPRAQVHKVGFHASHPFSADWDLLRCVGRGDVLTQAGHEFGGLWGTLALGPE